MNKDIIVLLLQKDIKELSLLTDGFEKMSDFPEPILRLARDKAESVLDRIDELSSLYGEELGAMDYESFGEDSKDTRAEIVEEAPNFLEKNNFDAPLDSHLEPPVNPHDIQDKVPEILTVVEEVEPENAIDYVDHEHALDNAFNDLPIIEEELIEDNSIPEENPGVEDLIDEVSEEIFHAVEEPIVEAEKIEPLKVESTHVKSVLKDMLSVEDNSLTNNLENQKIDDIRQAINIGDRFRFQRELFGGNGEVLNKTINYLNQLAKFSEAESFLKSKFGWTDDNIHAEEFLQIVKRRYV